jgi:WD40 repeat protein/tRNA A-37 threonylcarbamoyl transferase component Bud32
MVASEVCPDAGRLERFLLGLAPAAESAALGEHLLSCPRCQRAAGTLRPSDTLLEALSGRAPREDEADQRAVAELIEELQQASAVGAPLGVTSDNHRGLEPAGPALPAQEVLERLSDYRVLRLVGSGGMGAVYEAEDVRLQRRVALKVMQPSFAVHPTARHRFLREARAVAALDNDHIVPIHHVSETQDDAGQPVPFLIMPLLRGESLETRLQREQRLPLAEALRISREAAVGLAAAHAAGVIHRDIKPANLWLELGSDRVKVLDFGLARHESDEAGLTRQGDVMGTPAYMAPEQAGGGVVDPRADLFSLGCVLYRLCTGRAPILGKGVFAVLRSLAVEQPPAPHELQPEVPRPVSDFILRLLAKEPAGRPASAGEVAQTLRELEQALPVGTAPARRRRRMMTALAVGVLGCAAALGGVVIFIEHPSGQKTRIELAEGSSFKLNKDGSFTVTLPNGNRPVDLTPKADATTAVPRPAALQGPQPLDRLKRSDIPPIELANAGGGDPARAPPELVAVLGDSRFKHWQPAVQVLFHPEGKWLLSRGGDQSVEMWDVDTGRKKYSLTDPPFSDRSYTQVAAFSKDGQTVAVGTANGPILLFDTRTGKRTAGLIGHEKTIFSVVFHPTERLLASVSDDGTIRLWDLETSKTLWRAATPGIARLAFGPDGTSLHGTVQYRSFSSVSRWETATGKPLPPIQLAAGNWTAYLDDRILIAAREVQGGYGLRVWDLATGKPRWDSPLPIAQVESAALSLDRTLLASGHGDGTIRLWIAANGELVRSLLSEGTIYGVSFSPDGRTLATADGYHFIRLWDVATGTEKVAPRRTRYHPWHSLAFSPDGRTLLKTFVPSPFAQRCGIKLWDTATLKETHTLDGHRQPVSHAAFSPDGKRIATCSCSGDGTIKIWDRTTGAQLLSILCIPDGVNYVAWAPDGQALASESFNLGVLGVKLWNAQTGAELGASPAMPGPSRGWPSIPKANCWPAPARTARSSSGILLVGPPSRLNSVSAAGTASAVCIALPSVPTAAVWWPSSRTGFRNGP